MRPASSAGRRARETGRETGEGPGRPLRFLNKRCIPRPFGLPYTGGLAVIPIRAPLQASPRPQRAPCTDPLGSPSFLTPSPNKSCICPQDRELGSPRPRLSGRMRANLCPFVAHPHSAAPAEGTVQDAPARAGHTRESGARVRVAAQGAHSTTLPRRPEARVRSAAQDPQPGPKSACTGAAQDAEARTPGVRVRRAPRRGGGLARSPEARVRGPASARTSLRPHLAVTAAQWRLPYPRRGPSLTCSLTWTASFLVGSLRPPPSRAVRGGVQGRGGCRLSAPGRSGRAESGTPGWAAGAPWATSGRPRAGLWRRRRLGHYFRRPRRAWGRSAWGGRRVWGRRSGTTVRAGGFLPVAGAGTAARPQFPRVHTSPADSCRPAPGPSPWAPGCTHLACSILQSRGSSARRLGDFCMRWG